MLSSPRPVLLFFFNSAGASLPRIVRFDGRDLRLAPLDSRSFALVDTLRHQAWGPLLIRRHLSHPCQPPAQHTTQLSAAAATFPLGLVCYPRQAHINGRTRAQTRVYALNVASIYQPLSRPTRTGKPWMGDANKARDRKEPTKQPPGSATGFCRQDTKQHGTCRPHQGSLLSSSRSRFFALFGRLSPLV